MKTVNMLEAKTNLSRLVSSAAAGEIVVIANRGKPVVQLVPVREDPIHSAGNAAQWFVHHHVPGSTPRSSEDLDHQIAQERESWE